jgi:hypothetical protein
MNAPIDVQENIAVLHSIIDGIPEHLVKLEKFKQEQACGTIYCGIGWAAMHPYFQAQGLAFTPSAYQPFLNNRISPSFRYFDELFGEHAFSKLFDKRTEGMWDAELLHFGMTDKQLLLARLKKGYKENTPKCND